jgi:hypothetical protein
VHAVLLLRPRRAGCFVRAGCAEDALVDGRRTPVAPIRPRAALRSAIRARARAARRRRRRRTDDDAGRRCRRRRRRRRAARTRAAPPRAGLLIATPLGHFHLLLVYYRARIAAMRAWRAATGGSWSHSHAMNLRISLARFWD